jgi:primase-polymerase (primpol)-like protein
LPVKLEGVTPESRQILLEYLDEHKSELEYQQAITDDDSSSLAFFQYATKQMREKLQIYDELEDLQERSGGVNAVILMTLGVLVWLIS